ncbi:MAG: flagellar M-ring protein FliF [Candidatus Eremiobacteraeota bacterium]|nr:flagellar M-ring protein FliF [Candidatus Eremiobacteraeota bacterium]
MVAGLAIVVVGLGSLGFFFANHKPTYQVLFSNLAADDAVAVTARLKDDKVPYTLSSDGKSVYVPSQYLSDERVAIAGAGVVKGGGTGYELFDKMNFGMTEFQEKLGKTRAISGELERTIDGLTEVDTSRVHLATPDATLYSSTQQPTTASVAIKTKAGMSLTPQEVKGITLLVANAVEGLKPDDVTIINQDGNVLLPAAGSVASGDASTSDALKMTQEQLVAKQHYESNLQENIQSMLDQTLGAHRAVARVSTKMNFDANSSETKTYAPQGTVLSQQSKHESYNGTQPARAAAAGIPGTTSNIGTYQAVQNAPSQGKYNKSESTTNYDITEQNSKHIDAPGKVLQTSVAVLVNASSTSPTQAQNQVYALTPGNVAQIRNTVIAAADLSLAGGDQVSVEAIPFNPAINGANSSTQTATTVLGVPLWVLLALGGVGVLALLGLLAARIRRRGFAPSMDMPSFDSTLAEELPPFEEHPMLDGAPGLAAPIRSAADLTREQMIEYVTTVAQENPDSIAKLVKLWLAE